MTGNEACAEGAIQAGCRFYAGYPITPQNELTAYMSRRMREVGGTFIQAESELAAISMVFGASVAGQRTMTSSSSPGISLKQEGISYLSACELPAVVVNVMRGGPGLGNIAPSQADYFQATRGGGHGDYRTVVVAPASVNECMALTREAFAMADRYRMVVVVLADGILGQMMEPISSFVTPQTSSAGKRNTKNWILNGCKGRRPRLIRSLLLGEGQLEQFNKKLQNKYETVKKNETKYEGHYENDSDIFLIAYGTVSRIARSCVAALRTEGIRAGFIRPITLWPFPYGAIAQAAKKAKRMFVIEMSEGQMVEDVRLGVQGKCPVELYGRSGGGVPSEEEIMRIVKKR
jgi:2-oxoglutarate ferredoxin oxidoreductase subunit alpha